MEARYERESVFDIWCTVPIRRRNIISTHNVQGCLSTSAEKHTHTHTHDAVWPVLAANRADLGMSRALATPRKEQSGKSSRGRVTRCDALSSVTVDDSGRAA